MLDDIIYQQRNNKTIHVAMWYLSWDKRCDKYFQRQCRRTFISEMCLGSQERVAGTLI